MKNFKLTFTNSVGAQAEVIQFPDEITQEKVSKAAAAILSGVEGLTVEPTEEPVTVDTDLFISTFLIAMNDGGTIVVNSVQNRTGYDVDDHANTTAMKLVFQGRVAKGYVSNQEHIKQMFNMWADEANTIPVEDWQAGIFDLQETPMYYSTAVSQETKDTVH